MEALASPWKLSWASNTSRMLYFYNLAIYLKAMTIIFINSLTNSYVRHKPLRWSGWLSKQWTACFRPVRLHRAEHILLGKETGGWGPSYKLNKKNRCSEPEPKSWRVSSTFPSALMTCHIRIHNIHMWTHVYVVGERDKAAGLGMYPDTLDP